MSKAWRSLAYCLTASALIAACAHAQGPDAAPPPADAVPAETPAAAPAPAPAPAEAPSAVAPAPTASEGQALLQSACTSCHDPSPVYAHGRSGQDWFDVVGRMVNYGASGGDADLAAMKAYLAKTLPPGASMPPPSPPL